MVASAPAALNAAAAKPPIANLVKLIPPVVLPKPLRELRALLISSVNFAVSASSLIFKLLIWSNSQHSIICNRRIHHFFRCHFRGWFNCV